VARGAASGFSIGNKGYLGIGGTGGAYLQDFWQYTPDISTTAMEELEVSTSGLEVFPNPAKEFIVINYPIAGKENIDITVTSAEGKIVYRPQLPSNTSNLRFQTSNLRAGLYFVCLKNGKQTSVKKFLIE
jgi:hypothetical protein